MNQSHMSALAAPKSQVSPWRCNDLSRLASASPEGIFVEVGVYQGGSAYHLYQIAERQSRMLHLFDTFTGIPFCDLGDTFPVGAFSDTSAEAVQKVMPRAKLFKGVFPDTLPAQSWSNVAFAHFDCDQYRSTRDCIAAFLPRMVDGGVMAFDDYPDIAGVVRAVQERFTAAQVRFTEHLFAYVRCSR